MGTHLFDLRRVRHLLVLGLVGLAACSLEAPQLPEYETEWLVPLGERSYTVAQLLEDQEGLTFGEGGLISLSHQGDIDAVAVDEIPEVEVEGQVINSSVGGFELAAADPTDIDFTLVELYPAAAALDGMDVVVPPFTFDATSPAQDVPQITSATIQSGGIMVEVSNGLPVPVGGPGATESIVVELIDPNTTNVVASTTFVDEIPAGDSDTRFVDLAGATLPGDVAIHLSGGSLGSGGGLVTIDQSAQLQITATPQNLVASDAIAQIGNQVFSESTTLALPASPQVVSGIIESGRLQMTMDNTLAIPVNVDVTVPAFLDAQDQMLLVQRTVPAGAQATADVDLTLYRLDFGAQPGTEITVNAEITSAGSGAQEVALSASSIVGATVAETTIVFSEVTGIMDPEVIDLPEATSSLDMPEELENIELAAAELTFVVDTNVGMPATVNVRVEGTNDDGNMVPMDISFAVPAAPAGQTLSHEVVFNGDNSELLTFLNNLPSSIVLTGTAEVGDGVTRGTVAADDEVSARYTIDAPLLVSIDPKEIELDIDALDLEADLREQLEDRLLDATLETTVTSTLPIGLSAFIGLDSDEARVFTNPELLLGPVDVPASVRPRGDPDFAAGEATSQMVLGSADVPVLTQDTLFQGVRLVLPGTDGAVVSLRADDQVTVTGFLRARVHVGEIDQ